MVTRKKEEQEQNKGKYGKYGKQHKGKLKQFSDPIIIRVIE